MDGLQDYRIEFRILWLESNLRVPPASSIVAFLLAAVPLDGVSPSRLGIFNFTVLDQKNASLAGPLDRAPKEARRSFRNAWLHRSADHLRNEHTWSQRTLRVGLNPAIRLYRLNITEIGLIRGRQAEIRRVFEKAEILDMDKTTEGE